MTGSRLARSRSIGRASRPWRRQQRSSSRPAPRAFVTDCRGSPPPGVAGYSGSRCPPKTPCSPTPTPAAPPRPTARSASKPGCRRGVGVRPRRDALRGLLRPPAQARGAPIAGRSRTRAAPSGVPCASSRGLRAALDEQRGGKLAADLKVLYGYVVVRLTEANPQRPRRAGRVRPARRTPCALPGRRSRALRATPTRFAEPPQPPSLLHPGARCR